MCPRALFPSVTAIALFCLSLTVFAASSSAQGTFTLTGSLTTPTYHHSAILLSDGTVLILAGTGAQGGSTGPAQIYNPTTGTFANAAGTGSFSDQGPTAILLTNGKVLVAGTTENSMSDGAEIYDPVAGTFTPTGNMTMPRINPTLTLLKDGRVLVINGGACLQAVGSTCVDGVAEIYDPTAGTFTATGSFTTNHDFGTATLLSNGMVLVTGGGFNTQPGCTPIADLFDPAAGSFSYAGLMNDCRLGQSATLLNNGKVLIAGGIGASNAQLSSAEIYDPVAGSFSITGKMATPSTYQTATLLKDGTVLLAGGEDMSQPAPQAFFRPEAQVYEPDPGAFASTGSMNVARAFHTATLLNDGTVLVAGGFNDQNGSSAGVQLSSAEIYTPAITPPPTGPALTVSPSKLTFPSQLLDVGSAPQSVTLTNSLSQSVSLAAFSFTGTNGSDFTQTDNCGASLAPGASCVLNVIFTPTGVGARSATLSLAYGATGSPQTVALSGSGPDFSVSSGKTSTATVTAGQPATYTITVASATAFAQPVSLTCTGAPQNATCSVSPATVTPLDTTGVTTTVTVTTMARSTLTPCPFDRRPLLLLLAGASLLLFFACLQRFIAGHRMRFRRSPAFATLLLIIVAFTMTSCGGGSSGGGGGAGGTPSGTYTITVTGNFTSGSTTLSHATTLTLVVQ
jgi:hypothetical protein